MPHEAKSLIEMTPEELAINRERTFIEDANWREKLVDFDEIIKQYERTSDETDEEGLPWQNLIRSAVEDYVAVASANIPNARLVASRYIEDAALWEMMNENELVYQLVMGVLADAEENINKLVKTILVESDFQDEIEKAVTQSAVMGVGYIETLVDNSADTRFIPELKELFKKDFSRWSERDVARFRMLTTRISVRLRDSRDVYWQNGVRRVDDKMQRVSVVEHFDTESLRAVYQNDDIMAGAGPHHVRQKGSESVENTNDITAKITTYELVPVVREKVVVEDEGDGEVQSTALRITDWALVRTVIAGGQLLENEIIGSEWEDGSIRLPIVPFYLRESERHPYGFSIVSMLKLAERFINRVRILIYQSALHAISPQAVVGMVKGMGSGDEQRITDILQKGGFANIIGNDYEGTQKISDIVQQVIRNNPGVSNALVQAMENELRSFSSQAQSIDVAQIARAESGSAKRAQIAVADRPKTITLNLLSKAVEMVYDNVYDLIRNAFVDETPVSILTPEGSQSTVVLNEQVDEQVPVVNLRGEIQEDDNGKPIYEHLGLKLNDTSIKMKAQAEGRGRFPTDLPSKLVLVSQLMEMQLFKSLATPRELLFDEALIAKDDRNFAADQQRAQAASEFPGASFGAEAATGDVAADLDAVAADQNSQASLFEASSLDQETQTTNEGL